MKGYVFVLLAALQWGLTGPVAKIAFAQGVTPLEVAFWRATFGAVFFAAHALAIRQYRMRRKDFPGVFLFGLVGVSVFYGVYQMAISLGGAAAASILLYTAPAWVALLSRLFLGEVLGGIKLLAVALTIAGVAGVSMPAGDSQGVTGLGLAAVIYGLLSGFTYALYFLFGKIYLKRYETPNLFLYTLPVGALGLLPLVEFHAKTGTAWAALAFLGLFTTYGAYLAYCAGLKRLEATRAAVVCTLEPVVAAVAAYLLWGERFGPLGYAGSGLVFLAVALIIMDGRRKTGEPLGED